MGTSCPLYFWFLFIVGIQYSDGGQTCLSCNHVVQPRDCFKLTVCGQHEQCYMKRYVTAAGKIWYDIGCLDTSRCAVIPNGPNPGGFVLTMPPSVIGKRKGDVNETSSKQWTPPPSVIGRRQQNEDQVLCEHCCNDSAICNSGGYCKAEPLDNPGPVCYSCNEAKTADGCDQIKQCGQDEKCFIGQVINQISQEVRWTHDCKSNITCPVKDRKRQVVGGKICDDCCDHNLCNNVCTNYVDWSQPLTTRPVNSTQVEVTSMSSPTVKVTTENPTSATTMVVTMLQTTKLPTNKPITTVRPITASPTTARPITPSPTTVRPITEASSTKPPTTVQLPTQDPVRMIDCNFETGLCFWHQDKTDDGDWILHSGSTATANTGPENDHTYGTGKGHYIYLEASNLIYQNVVRLESNPVVWKTGTCLTFWYHMHGSFIASLNVYIKERDGSLTKLWSQSNEQGQNWLPAKVLLPATSGTIVIEGYRGADIHGDIAVDDIKLIENCQTG